MVYWVDYTACHVVGTLKTDCYYNFLFFNVDIFCFYHILFLRYTPIIFFNAPYFVHISKRYRYWQNWLISRRYLCYWPFVSVIVWFLRWILKKIVAACKHSTNKFSMCADSRFLSLKKKRIWWTRGAVSPGCKKAWRMVSRSLERSYVRILLPNLIARRFFPT